MNVPARGTLNYFRIFSESLVNSSFSIATISFESYRRNTYFGYLSGLLWFS